jgi:hypothetical protein
MENTKMATIKKAKCQCGEEYIDYDACIGKCAKCEGTVEAGIRQNILKNITYMTTDAAFKLVLSLLVATEVHQREFKAQRLSCEESHALDPKPEPVVKKTWLQRLFRR